MVGMFNRLRKSADRTWWLSATAALVVMLYFSYVQVKHNRYTAVFEEPSIAREVGELVKHSSRTVFVAHHYGLPLQYYGQFTGIAWPKRTEHASYGPSDGQERSVQERLALLEFTPEYFVVTDFKQLDERHQDLAAYLATRCLVLAQTTRYVVYRACDSALAQE
jgi:hypothetical protein